MSPALLAALLLLALISAGCGAVLVRQRTAVASGRLLVAGAAVGASALLLAQAGSAAAPRVGIMATMLFAAPALWAYPRIRARRPTDLMIGALLVLAGVGAVMGADNGDVLAITIAAQLLTLIGWFWWRLETAAADERRALTWCATSSAVAGFLGLLLSFVSGDSDWLAASGILCFSAVPLSMVLGAVRPELVDVRGLAVHSAVLITLAVAYVAYFVGLDALAEVAGVDLPPSGLAVVGLLGAMAYHPARRLLNTAMDRLLFGDRPDPLAAATQVMSGIGTTLADAVAALRAGLVVPFVQVSRGDDVVATAGEPVDHVRTVRLSDDPPITLSIGMRPGDLLLPPADARVIALVGPMLIQIMHSQELAEEVQASRRRSVAALEDVRRRLRRDLHDGLGPTLTGIAFATDAVRNTMQTDPVRAQDLLVGIRRDTNAAIEQIRHLVYGMRPPALDDLGLVAALRQRAAALRHSDGRQVRVAVDAPPDLPVLPAAVEVAAYIIVVEALTNVVRHSGARSARVALAATGPDLSIVVADDGGPTAPWAAGVGIASMRERAAELGGTLHAGPTPVGGRVAALLPTDLPDPPPSLSATGSSSG